MSNVPPGGPATGAGGGFTGSPPPGAPIGPSGGFGGPPSADKPQFTRNHLIAIIAVIAVLLAAIGGVLLARSNDAGAEDEVFLEPTTSSGDDPFTDSVASGTDGQAQDAIDADARSSSRGGVQSLSANQPGLYGGTQSSRHCDRGQLVVFLEANPGKARAWARVQDITVADIEDHVFGLTPVLLREDTRVTNHGFVSGVANAIPAVLQAGTAVLVDRFGRPVVKCACGNPLLAPTPATSPRYTGPRWTGFSETTITVIQTTEIDIDIFILTDPLTGERFRRPAGTEGEEDTPDEDAPATTVPPVTQPPVTAPPVTQPPVTAPAPTNPPQPSFGARGVLEQRLAQCEGVVFPFEEHVSETIEVESTGQSTVERVTLIGTTENGNQQFFSWLYDEVSQSLTPDSPLASEAAQHCSALSG